MNTARFLKYVWQFYNIMHQRVILRSEIWWQSVRTYPCVQKQPPRRVLRKRYSENMQRFSNVFRGYRSDQLYWNRSSAWVFFWKFAAYIQTTSEGLLIVLSFPSLSKPYLKATIYFAISLSWLKWYPRK